MSSRNTPLLQGALRDELWRRGVVLDQYFGIGDPGGFETLTLRVCSIGKSGFRFKSKSEFPNRTQNPKTDFTHLREIRPQGEFQLRNPNPDFMDFLFTVRLGNPKKDLQNYSREQWSSFC